MGEEDKHDFYGADYRNKLNLPVQVSVPDEPLQNGEACRYSVYGAAEWDRSRVEVHGRGPW